MFLKRYVVKKLPDFKASFITETFFPDTDPSDINCGQCFQWAYLAFSLFDGVELYDLPHHAFVKYKGKYYDSECPEGEEDWRELPACNWGLWFDSPVPHTPASFKREWRSQVRRFKTSWDALEKAAVETIEQGYH